MYRGFPQDLLARLRCPADAGALTLEARDEDAGNVRQGALRCATCARTHPIQDGIVRFLDASALDEESTNERTLREQDAARYDFAAESSPWQQAELVPTLEALQPLAGATVLELGAGTGRYTVRLLERGARVVALDFSLSSLQRIAERLQGDGAIGLVHADCTQVAVRPQSFDIAMSTLVSNLPTREHRAAMMAVAASAITPTGRFVFLTHYYGLGSRLRREPQSGWYRKGGIYRYLFRRAEIVQETRASFSRIACRPVQMGIPLAGRLHLPLVALSRLGSRLPVIGQFAELLLVVARPAAA